jgi:hypothetical protein
MENLLCQNYIGRLVELKRIRVPFIILMLQEMSHKS